MSWRKRNGCEEYCLNCAFCVRHREYWPKFDPFLAINQLGHSSQINETLTKDERNQIRAGNPVFMNSEVEAHKTWEEQCKLWKQELEKRIAEEDAKNRAEWEKQNAVMKGRKLGTHPFLSASTYEELKRRTALLQSVRFVTGGSQEAEDAKRLGMPKGPEEPSRAETDSVECYKDQWTKEEKGNWEKNKSVPDKKCEFHFPFVSCVGLEMPAIEKKQIHKIEMDNALATQNGLRISKASFWSAIAALIISVILGIFSVYNSLKDSALNEQWREKELEAIKAIPNNAGEIKKVNESVQENTKILEEIKDALAK